MVAVSDDLTPQLNANVLLKEILEPLGGRGGGKPVLAQGLLIIVKRILIQF